MRARWKGWLAASVAALLWTGAAASAQTGPDAAARQRLHQRDLEDTLRLQSQQAMPPRHTLTPSDARRLDELHRRQRAEQQQRAGEQLMLERHRAVDPDDRGLQMRERLLDQERTLQLQRFQLEQQELLRSARPPPLQLPAPADALRP